MIKKKLSDLLDMQWPVLDQKQPTQGEAKLIEQLNLGNEQLDIFAHKPFVCSFIVDEEGVCVEIDVDDADFLLTKHCKNNIIGKHLNTVLPIEKRNKITSLVAFALSSGKEQKFYYQHYADDSAENEAHTLELRAVVIDHYLHNLPDKKHVLVQSRDITRIKKILSALQEKEISSASPQFQHIAGNGSQLTQALSSNGIGVWHYNLLTQTVEWDDSMFALYGVDKQNFAGVYESWVESLHPDDREFTIHRLEDTIAGKTSFDIDFRICWPNGEIHYIRAAAKVFRDQSGRAIRILGTNIDISEMKRSQEQLKLAASVFTHSGQSIAITDASGNIVEINDSFTKMTGYQREEVLGQKPSILRSGYHPQDFYKRMWELLLKKGYWHGEIWNRRKNGEVYPGTLTISSVSDEAEQVTNYVGLITDITQEKTYQGQLEYMAYHDMLTDLPNRTLLADRLSQAMADCQQYNRLLAVAFLDLDGFKRINDEFGHEAGDHLLVTLSGRMKEILRESDTLARLGGDEFVAVFTHFSRIEDCELILQRLLEVASSPVELIGKKTTLQVSASIGVAIYPQDDADADLLLRHADQAMYIAKQQGKNRYHIFDTLKNVAMQTQYDSLQRIHKALLEDEFVLYYQPKVNMCTGDVVGAEALIRWMHPEEGMIPPNDFLPVINNHPLSLELDQWVINNALQQIEKWQQLGLNIAVSVNISAQQLQQKNFMTSLQALLAAHPEVSPKLLQLEVLETRGLSDVNNASEIMRDCMALGVSFALDDFGTGYSSLTYLRRLPAKLVKVDQSFVRDMLEDPDDLAIVEGVIGLAKSFKREVIAEGVETIEHGVALLRLGCVLAQGYGIARPMPADALPEWTQHWRSDDRWKSNG